MKKIEEDVMVLDDQNSKLNKVKIRRTVTMGMNWSSHNDCVFVQ